MAWPMLPPKPVWIALFIFSVKSIAAPYVPDQVDPHKLTLLESWAQRTGQLEVLYSSGPDERLNIEELANMVSPGDHLRVVFEVPSHEVKRLNIERVRNKILQFENSARKVDLEASGWEKGELVESVKLKSQFSVTRPNPARAVELRSRAGQLRLEAQDLKRTLENYSAPDFNPEPGFFAVLINGDRAPYGLREVLTNIKRSLNVNVLKITRVPGPLAQRFGFLQAGREWIRNKCQELLSSYFYDEKS